MRALHRLVVTVTVAVNAGDFRSLSAVSVSSPPPIRETCLVAKREAGEEEQTETGGAEKSACKHLVMAQPHTGFRRDDGRRSGSKRKICLF